jgi:branched-chain amino acid transport system permease protein
VSDALLQVLISGLTLGAMYAVGAIGLSITWGSLNVLNMAHGAMLSVGAYLAFSLATTLGVSTWVALLGAITLGGCIGALIYVLIVRALLNQPAFEVNVVIATIGVAFILENTVLQIYGGYPLKQPVDIDGGFKIGSIFIPLRSVLLMAVGIFIMLAVAAFLERTRTGRAVRAISQNKDAALLMGVRVGRIFALVLGISGALSAASGIMLSMITTLSPGMGYDPMLKALIMCVLSGLGNLRGALIVAIAIGILEAFVQFTLGVRFALPVLLLVVIVGLIWKPTGIFGRRDAVRL